MGSGATIEELSDDDDETLGESIMEKIKRENVTDTSASVVEDDSILARIKTETLINNEEDNTIIDRIINDYTQQHKSSCTIKTEENDDDDFTQHSMSLFSQY